MSIVRFNGDVPNWNIENLENSLLDDKESSENISRLIKYKKVVDKLNSIKLCNIEAIERIGSDSTAGEVYKYNLEKMEIIAIKILPIINSRSININNNEITLAKKVSNLVLENKSKYFPLVYYDIFCDSTYYYENSTSKFAIQSLNYQQYTYVKSELTKINDSDNNEIIKELDKIYKSGKNLNEIFKSIGIEKSLSDLNNKISSQLLFSELAYTDLRNYLTKKVSREILREIILQVFEGIKDLQKLAFIVHNDLHLGNVLLRTNVITFISNHNEEEYKLNILIHDFGRSKSYNNYESLSNIQKKTDILTFINEIKKYIGIYLDGNDYEYFNDKIQSIVELLDISENQIDDVLKIFDF